MSNNNPNIDVDFDKNHLWHPYTSALNPLPCFGVASASGVRIKLDDGRELIDGMSSWWSAIHGYNVPALNDAATTQLSKMSHVMFGGLTHAPAIELSKKLLALLPKPLSQVFLADSGSVAVEVALKMALQYWQGNKQPAKTKFVSFKRGYHGDTFGAMSVCDPKTGMHSLFENVLAKQLFAEPPKNITEGEFNPASLEPLAQLLATQHEQIAAVIIEPIVQGAGGMRIYHGAVLDQLRALCDCYNTLLIFDEIATGFGRTGKMFALEHGESGAVVPDIITVGKALTGGYMTLAATVCTKKVANGVCESEAGVFMHGPTFMGNPLACAVACASLDLLATQQWQSQVAAIEQQLHRELAKCRDLAAVADVRVIGAIGVVEVKEDVNVAEIQACFVEQGVWIRPFGTRIYVMPPYVIAAEDLTQLTDAIYQAIASGVGIS
ncbi:adenosylmethionine--8-amino-7-oxononanoate transaminase [Corallincola spongiicola]|uniref:Adenosylmethionine-8-amino-7-oxononanoate aminotransferase n=1 Tax=Corallincola spongiicola TaxID=2520508 RepID=A0ABY1WTP8_9GAMM|nr:adenosylmethionine--8-amino-7-oxononanoate transaminase [Corallincola spongiicola]TAA48119.1 adenosylmethionine--8-amino-7-oxononanoate transaminase [Corallincola spongiicola]